MKVNHPVVLSLSGHDPSGGAGIQADIETLISHQCHPCTVITALTEQDSRNVNKLIPQQPQDIIDQANTVLNDVQVKAIKIGLIGHHETAAAIRTLLSEHPKIPVVLDPVLAAGGGTPLAGDQLITTITEQLLPCTTVITPNSLEARRLAGLEDLNECGQALLDKGCQYALITGTHEQSTSVNNQLFRSYDKNETFSWGRLKHSYHGSGCTLASAIAALIAHGLDPFTAISEAQEYTWNALADAYLPGKGQHMPNRLFWVEENV